MLSACLLFNLIWGTGAGERAYLLPAAAPYAPNSRVAMLCLLILVLLLTRRCWCGYRHYPYYYGPYPYPYGTYTPYDPYWRARYYAHWYGYRRSYW
jgi:hypothetical protein